MSGEDTADAGERTAGGRAAWWVFWTFLKVGALSFGGPAATQGLVYTKAVVSLGWLAEEEFHRLLGMVNIIPGPNAVQMAMYIGHRRAGRWGFVLGGLAFVLPGTLISMALAAGYVRYGQTPPIEALLYGVKPVVIAVIAWSVFRLGRGLRPSPLRLALMAGAALLYAVGVNEVFVLALLGALMLAGPLGTRLSRLSGRGPAALAVPSVLALGIRMGTGPWREGVDLASLTLVFLKAGMLLFGGGTVLLAVLRTELVVGQGWLTQPQLLEAVTIGHMTPGSVLTAATFIGYLLAGWAGAVLATVAVMAPSFAMMTMAGPAMRLVERSAMVKAFLDGVTLAVVGIVAAVTVELGRDALVDPLTALMAVAGLGVLLWRPKAVLPLMLCGAAVGMVSLLSAL